MNQWDLSGNQEGSTNNYFCNKSCLQFENRLNLIIPFIMLYALSRIQEWMKSDVGFLNSKVSHVESTMFCPPQLILRKEHHSYDSIRWPIRVTSFGTKSYQQITLFTLLAALPGFVMVLNSTMSDNTINIKRCGALGMIWKGIYSGNDLSFVSRRPFVLPCVYFEFLLVN